MWHLISSMALLIAALLVLHLVTRIHRFSFVKRLAERNRLLSWMACILLVSPLALFLLFNVTTFLVVLMHFSLGFLFCDIGFFIFRKASGKDVGYDLQNCLAIGITVFYLAVGWVMAHSVAIKHYSIKTDKDVGDGIRIAVISDSHLGITLDGEGFSRQMERVNEQKPDIVVLVGDFVDDDSRQVDMVRACKALGDLDARLGVYFVYGNHDDGYFRYRDFSSAALRFNLEENNVMILEDRSVLVDGLFYVTGRKDRSDRGREGIKDLTEGLDMARYSILLDHQPNDYQAEASAGFDLVISGHTHGGHIFPAGLIGLATGANDRVYGTETRGSTTFVVTSGISGWAIPFKTGCRSEIVVIDINR